MSSAVSRRRARCARAAIALAVCPAAVRAQDVAGAVAAGPPPASSGAVLDPASPLAPLPDLGIDWPDLAAPDTPLAQLPDAPVAAPAPAVHASAAAPDAGGEQRYTITLDGLDDLDVDGLRARFDDLSTLRQSEAKPANVAQINRRAHEDAALLAELLRAYGYYDAEVDTRVGDVARVAAAGPPRLAVTLIAQAGPLYRFGAVSAPGLAATGEDRARLIEAFAIKAGQAVNADKVTAGVAALKARLGERGYAFATVGDPDITIDHDTHEATLTLPVEPGRAMRFGAFHVTGNKKVFGASHVARISRLRPGDRYNAARLDDLRRALIQTGLVSIAQITPRRTPDPQVVDLDVHIEPAPPRTIAGSLGYGTGGGGVTAASLGYGTGMGINTSALGYGTGQGITAEADWTHRNLFPPEGALTLRGVLGSQEQLASVIFRRNDFRTRDQVLTAQLALDRLHVPAYAARTIDFITSIERQTNIIWQKKWTYSYGLEFLGSDERDVIQATGLPRRRTYIVAALPLSLAYDGSDDLLNPSKGWRLSAHVSPEVSLHNSKFFYARIQLDGSVYQPIGKRVVLAGRLRLGSIVGANADAIAPSRRFYSGGGASVRGFGYQRIGPRDVDNDPVGGASLAEFGLEARVRFGSFGIVPFLDGGNLHTGSLPGFGGFRYGAGLGARYYTSFWP
ncbi:MAG TPA: BamA/TamA family outer membrane protein, partial [Sphingomonas sp.]